jgi:hypothetical protein
VSWPAARAASRGVACSTRAGFAPGSRRARRSSAPRLLSAALFCLRLGGIACKAREFTPASLPPSLAGEVAPPKQSDRRSTGV